MVATTHVHQRRDGDLRRALDADDEIRLHFQPKVAVGTGEIIGAEALARWQHPTRGPVPPVDFIPVLEGTGLIHRVHHPRPRSRAGRGATLAGLRSSDPGGGQRVHPEPYLKILPVDETKVDRSFVCDMAADQSNYVLAGSTVDLGPQPRAGGRGRGRRG
jgi:EAL domain-containing protein (putative c-di-GMP-specific phosphodiesterase class I)